MTSEELQKGGWKAILHGDSGRRKGERITAWLFQSVLEPRVQYLDINGIEPKEPRQWFVDGVLIGNRHTIEEQMTLILKHLELPPVQMGDYDDVLRMDGAMDKVLAGRKET